MMNPAVNGLLNKLPAGRHDARGSCPRRPGNPARSAPETGAPPRCSGRSPSQGAMPIPGDQHPPAEHPRRQVPREIDRDAAARSAAQPEHDRNHRLRPRRLDPCWRSARSVRSHRLRGPRNRRARRLPSRRPAGRGSPASRQLDRRRPARARTPAASSTADTQASGTPDTGAAPSNRASRAGTSSATVMTSARSAARSLPKPATRPNPGRRYPRPAPRTSARPARGCADAVMTPAPALPIPTTWVETGNASSPAAR